MITAGEISQKLVADTTKYDALEVGHAITENDGDKLYECARNYRDNYDEDEYCVVKIKGEDPIIKLAFTTKYYCWLYLPSPRPNQAVFLYNKHLDKITKRLWVLPNAAVMAELASLQTVHKRYQTMQAWSIAFFEGKFWEYIRYEHQIDMLSESEYISEHREELIKAGCKIPTSNIAEPFDFSNFFLKKVVDTVDPGIK